MKMSCEESIESRQENELAVLKSMYEDDVRDLRGKGAWNKWQPLDISLTLTPLRGSSGLGEVHAKVDLHVICSDKYPDVPPCISFENQRGIKLTILDAFRRELEMKARELCGEVMILSLAQLVQDFLYAHNKPKPESFYEEMLLNKKQKEQEERERLKLETDRNNQMFLNEVQQREEILKLDTRKRREQRLSSENSNDSSEVCKRRSVSSSRQSDQNDDIFCDHQTIEIIKFDHYVVQRGRCINHNKPDKIVCGGIDTDSGQMFKIVEWCVEAKPDLDTVQRLVSNVENEFKYLITLKHQNLVHYLGFNQKPREEDNKVVIHILQEFIFGVNCKNLYLYRNIPIQLDMLRHIAQGVLYALEFLHRNNIFHRNVSASCVNICSSGLIKLANYSLDRRLSDLATCTHSPSNHSKRTDIYKFGLLMLSLIQGSEVCEENCEIPQTATKELQDFLEKSLLQEEKERYTASQLLNHPFLKVPLSKFCHNKNAVENLQKKRDSSPDMEPLDIDMLPQSHTTGQSRVQNEFEILAHLGNGAYGAVFKVRNKLDQRNYALKRIELNAKNNKLNKKIVKEVKVLSSLNHENVVRYYNSWIETDIKNNDSEDSSSLVTTPLVTNKKGLLIFNECIDKNIELLAPPMRSIGASAGLWSETKTDEDESSSDDDSSDDDDSWGGGLVAMEKSSGSDFVEFKKDDIDSSKTMDCIDSITPDVTESLSKEIQFMYIQMEFCEKSTLRTAIDNGLYSDNDRVWRLFREIIEGLSHIHLQGMIHRDLKPMNIFLDHKDHVKIGDFGLATTNLLEKHGELLATNKSYYDSASQDGGGDPSMTGRIGTVLYVAPELSKSAKANYNNKVDIYSLGIIFFEMSYKPMYTGSERISVLDQLRSDKIIFPLDFKDYGTTNQEHIIRWLLHHHSSKRPTPKELLQSDKLPPPVLEECKMQEFVRHTLRNTQLKSYKYLVESCFKQPVTPAQDITYDKDTATQNVMKNLHVYNNVKALITKVFQIHGAQNLPTPLLIPRSKYYEKMETCVKLMTHSGSIVSIPHDLRVPFARYVAWNGLISFRRYSIERVYREKKVFGFIPRELYECAFDIVTPTPGKYMADAEVLYILNEVINMVPGFKNRNVRIHLNHTQLLNAILLHCGVKDKQNDLFNLLSEAREGRSRNIQLRAHLIIKGLPDHLIETLVNFLESEVTMPKLEEMLINITKKSNEASKYAKQAVKELKVIIQNTEALGTDLTILICPGMVYNVHQYSGMLCQLVCEIKRKHRQGFDVIAAGGRYDGMIGSYRNMMLHANKDLKQSAVGISISLDRLVLAMEKDELNEQKAVYLDVVVCSLGVNHSAGEKSAILHDLWSVGIRCCIIEANTLEDIQEQCQELNVSHVIILKDTERGSVRVRSLDKDRIQEKRIPTGELIETMKRMLKTLNELDGEQPHSYNVLMRSESKVSHTDHSQDEIVTILYQEKWPPNVRKKHENHIHSQLSNVFKKLIGAVTVFAVSLDGAIIKIIALYLDCDSTVAMYKSMDHIKEKNRLKCNITEICEKIYELKNQKSNPVVILYSLVDSLYKVLL